MAAQQQDEKVEVLAKDTATFYNTLVKEGVPDYAAAPMAQEYNHRVLRSHFKQ